MAAFMLCENATVLFLRLRLAFSLRPHTNDHKQTFMKTEDSQSELESVHIFYPFA